MPLVDIHLIEGVFDKKQKQDMISKITDAMVEIEGESMRGITWVRVCSRIPKTQRQRTHWRARR